VTLVENGQQGVKSFRNINLNSNIITLILFRQHANILRSNTNTILNLAPFNKVILIMRNHPTVNNTKPISQNLRNNIKPEVENDNGPKLFDLDLRNERNIILEFITGSIQL